MYEDVFDPPYKTNSEAFESKLKKARKNIAHARSVIKRGEDVGNAITRLKGAKNRLCEAVLVRDCGYFITADDDKDTLHSRFLEVGPPDLIRKAELLEEKLTMLYYGDIFTEQCWQGVSPPMSEYPDELMPCFDEVDALYLFVAKGGSLPDFRWERKNNLKPGQWVLQLRNNKKFDTVSESFVYHWQGHPMRVLSIDERWTVIKHPDSRRFEWVIKDSIFLKSTGRFDNLSSAFETRRIWFDLHPEYSQIPLKMEPKRLFGDRRYFTCPCCGYPVMTTHCGYPRSISNYGAGEHTEICLICDWADSFQADDGYFIDESDMQNFGYSLRQGRNNFAQYGSIFQPSDGIYYLCHRSELLREIKDEMTALFDWMIGNICQGQLYLLWCRVEYLRLRLPFVYEILEKQQPSSFTSQYDDSGKVVGRNFRDKHRSWSPLPPIGRWISNSIDGYCLIIDARQTGHGGVMTIRNSKREQREVVTDFGYEVLDRYSDPTTQFQIRRSWFEAHPEYLRGHFPCPCCAVPTIRDIGGGEICRVCGWLDDGRDDVDDTLVRESANNGLSLRRARENVVSEISVKSDKQNMTKVYEQLITVMDELQAEAVWQKIEALWSK